MGNGVPGGDGADGVHKGNTGIIIAILLLLGVGGGVLYFATRNKEEKKTVTTVTSAQTATPPPPTMDLPSIDLPVDAGDETGTDAGGKNNVIYVNPCSSTCNGTITDEIKKVVNARANTAKQCYKSAIQDNEALSGDMNFSLVIGSNGQTCSVNITSDTTGSPKLQQCVRQRLGVNYPSPKGGCAPVAGTISFRNKGA